MIIRSLTLLLICISLITISCSESSTPEDQIRGMIQEAKIAAEKKDIGILRKFISDRYLDERKRSKKEIQRLLMGYFLRNNKIYLLNHIDSISLTTKTQAEVLIYVAMASTQLPNRNILKDIRADFHRMDLHIIKQDSRWQVQSAQWRQANIQDFFPE